MLNMTFLNPIVFKYLFDNIETKSYIINLVNTILNANDNYKMLNYFNHTGVNRSYFILESALKIILIDFNFQQNNQLLNYDLAIINFVKLTNNKEIVLLIFNDYPGINNYNNNIINIYQNENNLDFIKFLMKMKYQDNYDVINNYITHLDNDFKSKYEFEIEAKNNLLK